MSYKIMLVTQLRARAGWSGWPSAGAWTGGSRPRQGRSTFRIDVADTDSLDRELVSGTVRVDAAPGRTVPCASVRRPDASALCCAGQRMHCELRTNRCVCALWVLEPLNGAWAAATVRGLSRWAPTAAGNTCDRQRQAFARPACLGESLYLHDSVARSGGSSRLSGRS